eukprot:4534081-Ditylum_brightwellii.AAC.1
MTRQFENLKITQNTDSARYNTSEIITQPFHSTEPDMDVKLQLIPLQQETNRYLEIPLLIWKMVFLEMNCRIDYHRLQESG